MEILVHVNKRLKGAPAVKLPLTELLAAAAVTGESGRCNAKDGEPLLFIAEFKQ